MAPLTPVSTPASAASWLLGATPVPSTTRSAVRVSPLARWTAPGSKAVDRGPAPDLDAVTDHGRAHQRRHVRVEGAHDLRGLVDDGDRRPEADVGLGHLEADVAAPHHDDVSGQAPAVPVEQALGVGQGLHAEHGLAVDARHVRSVGAGPGGDDQLVVGEAHRAAVLVVPDLDLAGVGVDGHRLVAEAHVDAVVVPELLRRPGDQFLDPLRRRRRRGRGCRRPSS